MWGRKFGSQPIDRLDLRWGSGSFEPRRRTPRILVRHRYQAVFHRISVRVVEPREIGLRIGQARFPEIEPHNEERAVRRQLMRRRMRPRRLGLGARACGNGKREDIRGQVRSKSAPRRIPGTGNPRAKTIPQPATTTNSSRSWSIVPVLSGIREHFRAGGRRMVTGILWSPERPLNSRAQSASPLRDALHTNFVYATQRDFPQSYS